MGERTRPGVMYVDEHGLLCSNLVDNEKGRIFKINIDSLRIKIPVEDVCLSSDIRVCGVAIEELT